MRIATFQVANDLLGVRIQQQFLRVKTVSFVGLVGAVNSVAIDKSGARLRQVAVPDLIGLIFDSHAVQFAAAGLIE